MLLGSYHLVQILIPKFWSSIQVQSQLCTNPFAHPIGVCQDTFVESSAVTFRTIGLEYAKFPSQASSTQGSTPPILCEGMTKKDFLEITFQWIEGLNAQVDTLTHCIGWMLTNYQYMLSWMRAFINFVFFRGWLTYLQ